MDPAKIAHVALMLIALAIGGVGLFCFVRVLNAMRENGEATLALLCLVGLLLGGAGLVVAFVYGILKSRDWEVAPTMMLWGACLALHLALWGAFLALPT